MRFDGETKITRDILIAIVTDRITGGVEGTKEMKVTPDLIAKLKKDGETSEENLRKLIWLIANKETIT